jgi:lipopolysaccharide/colanic/teichoic acid biosynthesis glycosyltransferase
MPSWMESQTIVALPNEKSEPNRNGSAAMELVAQTRAIFPTAVSQTSSQESWLQVYSEALNSAQTVYAICKRGFDIVASLSLLFVLSPVLFLITLLIVVDSPGWPIFRQLRKGKNQKPFYIYKFRTMVNEAARQQARLLRQNDVDGILFKLKSDPRITRVGRFLRAYSIDELPQLVNVLKGDMSLVGPRPFSLEDFSRSSVDDETFKRWLMERHQVPPGVTGLWQISGRNDIPFDKLMELDLLYVRHSNPLIDAVILGKTVGVVLTRKGAY